MDLCYKKLPQNRENKEFWIEFSSFEKFQEIWYFCNYLYQRLKVQSSYFFFFFDFQDFKNLKEIAQKHIFFFKFNIGFSSIVKFKGIQS
jgi:hypothetical protein